ncbi:MAG: DNA repair protein RecO [Pseudomonadota bacterium]
MRVEVQPAFVLHSRPYRDSSAIVELFTAEYGRFSAVARGVRRAGKRRAQVVVNQPFVPLLVSFSGRSELKTLGQCELAGRPHRLQGDSLLSGLYLNELLMRLLHRHDPHPRLFAAYGSAIESLGHGDALEPELRQFELQLIDELGYSFDFGADAASGEGVREDCLYVYEAEVGMVATQQRPASGKPAYQGADLRRIAAGEVTGEAAGTAKRLLREVLSGHLGHEPLRSRALFRSTRNQGEQP